MDSAPPDGCGDAPQTNTYTWVQYGDNLRYLMAKKIQPYPTLGSTNLMNFPLRGLSLPTQSQARMPAPESSVCTRSEDQSRGDEADTQEAPGQPSRERNSLAKAGASRGRSHRSRMEEAGGGGGRRRRLGWCPAEDAAPAQALAQLLEPRGRFAAPAAAWSHPGCPACRHAGGGKQENDNPAAPSGPLFLPKIPPHHGAAPVQNPLHTAGQCP